MQHILDSTHLLMMSPKERAIIQVCGIHCGSPIGSFRMNAQFAKDHDDGTPNLFRALGFIKDFITIAFKLLGWSGESRV
ncbi:9741_t:CDS:2, partial [Dentiscutata heterogama]